MCRELLLFALWFGQELYGFICSQVQVCGTWDEANLSFLAKGVVVSILVLK